MNCSDGLGIHEHGIKKEGLSRANLFHLQLADVELQRQLIWSECVDYESRLLTDELVHINLDLSSLDIDTRPSLFFWWNIQLQAFQIYTMNSHRRMQQIEDARGESEFINRNQRLSSRLLNVYIACTEDLQSLT